MISTKLNNQIHVFLTCLLAFLIPSYHFILAPVIILIGLNWLINPKNIMVGFTGLFKNYGLMAMVALYGLYLIGMMYSNNMKFGGEVIETKMSFLLFPLIYSSYASITKQNIYKYLTYFIYGCILYALVCFVWASYCFFKPVYTDLYGVLYDLGANYFYYSYLAKYYHPSYTSMYSAFALVIIAYLLYKGNIKINWKWILAIGVLCLYILLLSSKAGWIVLAIWALALVGWLMYTKKYSYVFILSAFLIGSFLSLNIYFTPSSSQRIPKMEVIKDAITEKDAQNKKVTTSDDGSARRVFVWKASLEVIKQNLLFGVGTGDSRDNMLEMYEQKGMIAEHKAKLNSHNQYLNTSVSLGLIGFVSLLLCLLIPFYFSFKEKAFVCYGFVVIIAINLLFESMFEKQAGVIFYAFFNTLLCLTYTQTTNNKQQTTNE